MDGGDGGAAHLTDVPVFPQLPGRLDAAMGTVLQRNPQSEDAYLLNVWAPRDAHRLPVIVFIHGGAWTTGGGSAAWYDGSRLAADGAVVVTVNYRLGPLAHLSPNPDTDPTPLALGDLLHALRWVRRNIGALGGDPARVALAGQSTGGWYAHLLNILPEAQGLFDRVALWSMATRHPWSRETLARHSSRTVEHLADQHQTGDLRDAPVEDLLRAGAAMLREQRFPFGTPGSAYLPSDSAVLPEDLYDANSAARRLNARILWVRTTATETGAFFFTAPERAITADQWAELLAGIPERDRAPHLDEVDDPYQALLAQTSWQHFERFPLSLARAATAAGCAVRVSRFEVTSSLDGFGSGHTFDLPYQFGAPTPWQDAPMMTDWSGFEANSAPMRQELYEFATARPPAPGTPAPGTPAPRDTDTIHPAPAGSHRRN